MLEFEWLWAVLVLPLPLIFRLLPAKATQQQIALTLPTAKHLPTDGHQNQASGSRRGFLLAVIAWCCLVFAAMRPQWLGEPITLPSEGRDLMLAVDLSGSMDEQDMLIDGQQVNRLTMVKHVMEDFIARRVGDRLGLILFADTAYLQTPLTHDRATVAQQLNDAVLGLVGERTAIGDSLGLAAKRFDAKEETNKILILLTDGQNTAGNISPKEGLTLATEKGITVYTIGVGADRMFVQSFFGRREVNPSRDLDETLLTSIAEQTGGQYFRARDTEALEAIYATLDELEPIQRDTQTMQPLTELFHMPLSLALLFMFLSILWRWIATVSFSTANQSPTQPKAD